MNKSIFEEKIRPILKYVGGIGAVILMIAYIAAVIVLIQGFSGEALLQTTIFGLVNAAVGFIIMQFLKIQGIDFAKSLPDNIPVIKAYSELKVKKAKKKKYHTITFFWIKSASLDALIKCGMLAVTTAGLIYIVIEGTNDWNLLLLAFVNLLMFICFGLLSLVKAYDFYNSSYVNYMKDYINEAETKSSLEKIKTDGAEQRDVIMDNNSRDNLLEPVDSTSSNGTSEPVLLDNIQCVHSLLGNACYPSDTDSTSDCICTKETV